MYFKKEVTEGTETDLLGREVSKLWLYTSPDSLGSNYSWSFSELWTQWADDQNAERIEGNKRLWVLRLPPYQGSTWNGNFYNNEGAQTYEYINLDTTVTIQGTTYENCVYVLQVPFRQPVEQQGGAIFIIEHAYEIYAPGIGKIVRYCKYFVAQDGVPESESKVYYEELVSHNFDL